MPPKTAAQVKRLQLIRAKNKLTELRSSAYIWHNLPEEALVAVEAACENMARAIEKFDDAQREAARGYR
jgi:hypothetical protein